MEKTVFVGGFFYFVNTCIRSASIQNNLTENILIFFDKIMIVDNKEILT